jgi:23S rRNA (cytosine1962-C5)-methyltransferase
MNEDATIILKRHEERRLLGGHLWVFSNEIEKTVGNPENGACVQVVTGNGKPLGIGFYNKNSLIAVRMLSKPTRLTIDDIIRERILHAESRRKGLGYTDSYRVVHGESDLLPGLIVDRYGETLVIESFSAGIDNCLPSIISILDQVFEPSNIIEKSTSMWRSLESIENRSHVWKGTSEEFIATVSGLKYRIQPLSDQKTGLFLDQSMNRQRVEMLAQGKAVLDCFCNVGGFSLHAARGGAASVTAVDISAHCVSRGSENAALNVLSGIQFVERDGFDFLDQTAAKYDLIILDPPAFVKNKKSLSVGLKAYRKINERAMRLLNDGGILVSCSCSHHVSTPLFLDMMTESAARQGKQVTVFETAGASADHPVLLSMPETQYLTCVYCQVRPMD